MVLPEPRLAHHRQCDLIAIGGGPQFRLHQINARTRQHIGNAIPGLGLIFGKLQRWFRHARTLAQGAAKGHGHFAQIGGNFCYIAPSAAPGAFARCAPARRCVGCLSLLSLGKAETSGAW
jgi:hypothetical protein